MFAEISSEEETKKKKASKRKNVMWWALFSHSLNEVIVSSLFIGLNKVVSDPKLQIKGHEKVGHTTFTLDSSELSLSAKIDVYFRTHLTNIKT